MEHLFGSLFFLIKCQIVSVHIKLLLFIHVEKASIHAVLN